MKKRVLCVSLALLISASQVMTVSASREEQLRLEQAYTNEQLNNTYARINELEYAKQALRAEINELDANLVNIMVSINVLEGSISEKEASIEKTSADLQKAEKAKDKQYENMKKRIQLLYEKGGNSAWFQMLMEADDLSELLTRAEYTQKMYELDRENLDKYTNTVEQVKELGEKYAQEKADLEAMHNEYALQQQELEYQISVKEATSANCDAEITYAQNQAYQYAVLLEQQTAEIAQLEAERIAAEQAAAAAAAQAQAEAQAAAQAQAQAQAETQIQTDSTGETGVYSAEYDEYGNVVYNYEENASTQDTYTDYNYSGESTAQYDEYGNLIVDNSSVDYNYTDTTGTTTDTTTTTTPTGSGNSAVVDFATQFVGNPYVWGGTSLTNGADCSGFVQSVYSNFGVDLPRTSYDQMTVGQEVSYADAQPGDLICYGGHIAIYMGNGQIVHAANSEQGIIISDNAAYDTILSVRRVL